MARHPGLSRTPRVRAPSPLLEAASSLIGEASQRLVTAASRFQHSFEAPVARIAPNPEQPRMHFATDEIAGLAATMAEHGQLQPVLLRRDPADRERWILVAGERRWRAARSNGWPSLLAIEVEGEADVLTILENLQRVDLSPVEEARGLQHLIARRHWSQDRAAEALGKSKAHVSATLRILTLPAAFLDQALTVDPPLSRNLLVELARLDEPTQQGLLARARWDGLTIRDIRAAARSSRSSDVRTGSPAETGDSPGPRRLDVALLDAATDEIEAAIRKGAVLDAIARQSLERLRQSTDSLLRVIPRVQPGDAETRR